ncbi:MAG: PPC domain-containing DNA-binding protein [Candidatus Micrarchaeota archaeon]
MTGLQSAEKDELVFVRLFPGEDLYASLKQACAAHAVETAVVLSAVGQLKNFELGYFRSKGDYAPQTFEKPFELLALSGIVSRLDGSYNFHVHATLSGGDKTVVGGHLIRGTVEVTGEIVLLKSSLPVKRITEETTGLKGLFLE